MSVVVSETSESALPITPATIVGRLGVANSSHFSRQPLVTPSK